MSKLAGLNRLSQRLLQGASGPLVLMYHGIEVDECVAEQHPWSVSYAQFCAHLDVLQAFGWQTCLASALVNPSQLPARSIIITFDDGYANNFIAAQALAQRSMVATWFIVSDTVGQQVSWASEFFHGEPMLTHAQLLQMQQMGMEIGSHGCSHLRLSSLTALELQRELVASKQILSELMGREIISIAYPKGDYSQAVLAQTQQAGYQLGFSCHSGKVLADFNPILIKRLAVYRDDEVNQFARKLSFADNQVTNSMLVQYGLAQVTRRCQQVFQSAR